MDRIFKELLELKPFGKVTVFYWQSCGKLGGHKSHTILIVLKINSHNTQEKMIFFFFAQPSFKCCGSNAINSAWRYTSKYVTITNNNKKQSQGGKILTKTRAKWKILA